MERDVEKYLLKKVKALGGACYKWVAPGNNGVADRIVCLAEDRKYFVELKADESKQLRPEQKVFKKEMNKMGIPVYVLKSKRQVDKFIKGIS